MAPVAKIIIPFFALIFFGYATHDRFTQRATERS